MVPSAGGQMRDTHALVIVCVCVSLWSVGFYYDFFIVSITTNYLPHFLFSLVLHLLFLWFLAFVEFNFFIFCSSGREGVGRCAFLLFNSHNHFLVIICLPDLRTLLHL